ncbi:MAG: catalase family protein [Sphingomonadaceae bacterium]|nr:catalase family protein [Sphingomonadaceae bacterium]
MPAPVPYSPGVETIEPDEAETQEGINAVLRAILDVTSKDYGHAVRSVHAKGHGIAEGVLEIVDGLSPELAQGLFARGGRYDAILRISTNPGDILDDSISVPRGAALKVIGVDSGSGSQDFVLVDEPAFFAPNPKMFLQNLKLLARTTDKAEGFKRGLSAVLRAAEGALELVGLQSSALQSLGGAANSHPLGRTYFSQTAFRYGDHIAKFQLAPVSPNLVELAGATVHTHDRPDALREDVREVLAEQETVWELRVQLCTDLEAMPIEDASVAWDEKQSPFRTVARLIVEPQAAWEPGISEKREDELAFTPWHCLEAHRPLGGVNRARKPAYEMSSGFRGRFNGCPVHEPRALAAGRAPQL